MTKVTDTDSDADEEPLGDGAPDPLWLAGAECAFSLPESDLGSGESCLPFLFLVEPT